MAYNHNNTPPGSVLKHLSDCDSHEHEDLVVFENELYRVVSREHYYALHTIGERADRHVIIRECTKEQAVDMAIGLTLLKTNQSKRTGNTL